MALSRYQWSHGGKQYEVNSFHHADAEAWCYELYASEQEPGSNDYVEVLVPDVTPIGPFTPAPATEVE